MSSSKKRLMKDLKEIQMNSLHTISALPLENDIYTWYFSFKKIFPFQFYIYRHANLKARRDSPYQGGIFHLELKFPLDYPFK